MPTFKIYLLASVLMLAPAGAIAQTVDRIVPLPDHPAPQFLTPLSDDGFVDGRSDAIPELTEDAIIVFFGKRRMPILYDVSLTEQTMDALSGPPFDQIDLGNAYFVYVGCRAHSCGERGAVIMDANGRIGAAALIGYRCREEPEPICDDMPLAYAFIEGALEGSFAERLFVEFARREDIMPDPTGDESNRSPDHLHIIAM